jgi:hypothetical protein
MKRSQALNIIWEAINELEDANYILKRLEDAGMQPPAYRKRHENPIFGPDWFADTYEWEPENE